jgi:putative Holliday junction resolvase
MALDVGEARVGVALANTIARLPSPLVILQNEPGIFEKLQEIAESEKVETVIVGLPRNMKGEETAQSHISRQFGERLEELCGFPVIFVDESLSTKRAEEYARQLKRTGKHLDDIAACFILEEYLGGNKA